MGVLQDIFNWIQTLPLWQQDAARRLFEKPQGLSEKDIKEIYDLFKQECGIDVNDSIVAITLPLDKIPAIHTYDGLRLKSLQGLKHVNCIDSNQCLNFSLEGMTIVYGGNGCGKSGYARVFKKACFSRDTGEIIYPNAEKPEEQNEVPEATFVIENRGICRSIQWKNDISLPHKELATIAVFDSKSARISLSTEHEAAYVPYGLDIVDSLANAVIPQVNDLLQKELSAIDISTDRFASLQGDNSVGHLIQQLDSVDMPLVISLGTFSDTDKSRLSELRKTIAENNPEERYRLLLLEGNRLKNLLNQIKLVSSFIATDHLNKYKEILSNYLVAKKAEQTAAEELCKGENLLVGTGNHAWKTLFISAQKFICSNSANSTFPPQNTNEKCPLCQEPLSSQAIARLQRFYNYIQDDISQMVRTNEQQLSACITKVRGCLCNVPGLDSYIDEIKLRAPELIQPLQNYFKELAAQKALLLNILENKTVWQDPLLVDSRIIHDLRNLIAKIYCEARTYKQLMNNNSRNEIKREINELEAREKLSVLLPEIEAWYARKKYKQILGQCISKLNTKNISIKAKEFAKDAITTPLKNALDDEFRKLNAIVLKTTIKERGAKGKVLHRLILDLPVARQIHEILSEGEQKAIAIASFLAEISISDCTNAIVFDDPISSLDHWRRDRIAKRLSEECLRRQVIIFTHDPVFVCQLQRYNNHFKVPFQIQTLERKNESTGMVSDGLPWDHKTYKSRLDELEKIQKNFEKLPWPAYPNETLAMQMREAYGKLRATIERAVQDLFLNGTIQRFDDYVRVKNLDKVCVLTETDYHNLFAIYNKCSDVMSGHDHSPIPNSAVPTARDLKDDLVKFTDIINEFKSRTKY